MYVGVRRRWGGLAVLRGLRELVAPLRQCGLRTSVEHDWAGGVPVLRVLVGRLDR